MLNIIGADIPASPTRFGIAVRKSKQGYSLRIRIAFLK
jgi:hypothetical protein